MLRKQLAQLSGGALRMPTGKLLTNMGRTARGFSSFQAGRSTPARLLSLVRLDLRFTEAACQWAAAGHCLSCPVGLCHLGASLKASRHLTLCFVDQSSSQAQIRRMSLKLKTWAPEMPDMISRRSVSGFLGWDVYSSD